MNVCCWMRWLGMRPFLPEEMRSKKHGDSSMKSRKNGTEARNRARLLSIRPVAGVRRRPRHSLRMLEGRGGDSSADSAIRNDKWQIGRYGDCPVGPAISDR